MNEKCVLKYLRLEVTAIKIVKSSTIHKSRMVTTQLAQPLKYIIHFILRKYIDKLNKNQSMNTQTEKKKQYVEKEEVHLVTFNTLIFMSQWNFVTEKKFMISNFTIVCSLLNLTQ